MDLGRLAHDGFREWRAPMALAALLVAMQALGVVLPGALRYERAAILDDGEWLRLVTGHYYHYDLAHLGWNLAGLALVAWLFAREYSPAQWLVIMVASTVAVDLGFLLLEPQLQWYVGFSGVLHGLMAAGLLAWWVRHRDGITLLVSVLFALKLGWEHAVGALPFTAGTLAIPVVHAAHTYGAVGGALAAAWLCARRPQRTAPV
jgi:rhomboid family GlyGly-CTERM serine protease